MGADAWTTAAGLAASDSDLTASGRFPTDKPPFTIAEIKRAIPPHCFQRSVVTSSSYLLRDVAVAAALLYFAVAVIPTLPLPLRLVAWPLYWAVQGCAPGGVWVIAHECGHHAFSEHALLDDAVGFALHTALLVPYFWKHSHRRHHSNSGSLERDEVFVPRRRSELHPLARRVHGSAAGRLAALVLQLVVGWPVYLACNATGRPYPRFACHFDPYSPIFTGRRERTQVLLSDAGVLAFTLALRRLAVALGSFWAVARVYGAPLLVVNAWLVLVTYLQHTDPAVPRYGGGEWDWLRGALATVDRDYGALLTAAFHNITDTHVVHHLFPTLPHYHAAEATRAIRPVLGAYYRFDATPVAQAAWRAARECVYVEPDGRRDGVFWYGNKFY